MEINDQDWELVNDDGFIYRRPKRIRPEFTDPPPDPEPESKTRAERKKGLLLKLKTKYQQEIGHWELLSNTLRALNERTQNQPVVAVQPVVDDTASDLDGGLVGDGYQELAGTLLAQVEAQEATINEISRLCDAIEAFCDAEEQRLKQPFIDLPIWESSPRELITSLLED
ncbi:uncharacterized protein LOC143588552 [Bidens hawaiensis]|uniref:uncharacterized protein LOC143588552 n=1 Tax=Bidens hawaiensis TaxID=980011 RepID=UPI00404A0D84